MSRAREFADLAGAADAGGTTGQNLFINGNFDVWQRATSFTDAGGIWKYGHADRWNGHNDGADAGTWSQSTEVPNDGSTYSMLMTGASSVTNTNFSQRVESDNLHSIRTADAFTISGWVKSATAGKVINIHALCPTVKDAFNAYTQHNNVMTTVTITGNGTTGSSQLTLTDADTWYYFTATKTSATSLTNFDKGYAVFFSIIDQDATTEKVYMSQLKLEAGTRATPFQHRSYTEELSLCQRYCYVAYEDDSTTNFYASNLGTTSQSVMHHSHPVEMRTSPTGTINGFTVGTQSFTRHTKQHVCWGWSASDGSGYAYFWNNVSPYKIYTLDAEL